MFQSPDLSYFCFQTPILVAGPQSIGKYFIYLTENMTASIVQVKKLVATDTNNILRMEVALVVV